MYSQKKMTVLRFILTIAFIQIVQASSSTDKALKSQINDARHAAAFNRLLSSIATVNEKRLNSIKKLNELQSLNPYPDISDSLRSDFAREDSSESSESDSEGSNIVYLVIPDRTVPETTNVSEELPVSPQPQQPNKTELLSMADPIKPRADVPTRTKSSKVAKKQEIPVKVEDTQDNKNTNESLTHLSLNKDGFEFLRQSIERSCRNKEAKRCTSACKEAASNACSVYECKKKLKKSLKKNCKKSCKNGFKNSW